MAMAAAAPQTIGAQKGMIFLENGNPILYDALTELMGKESKKEPVDIKVADFDMVEYHILVAPERKDEVQLSIRMKCVKEVLPMGTKAVLDATFGLAIQDKPEATYDLTLKWNIDKLPNDESARKAIITSISEIRRIVMAAPLERCFEALSKNGAGSLKPMIINYRQKESVIVNPMADRILVFFYN